MTLAEHECFGGPLDGAVIGAVAEDPVSHECELPIYTGHWTMGQYQGDHLRSQFLSGVATSEAYRMYGRARYRLGDDGRLYYVKTIA